MYFQRNCLLIYYLAPPKDKITIILNSLEIIFPWSIDDTYLLLLFSPYLTLTGIITELYNDSSLDFALFKYIYFTLGRSLSCL